MNQSREKANKIFKVLTLLAGFCLIFYLYIVIEPVRPFSTNMITQDEKCFEKFRKNNCSLENPIGDICRELQKCIFSRTTQAPIMASEEKEGKIFALEEMLENCLLMFTGMGIMSILTPVLKLRTLFLSMARNLKDVMSKIKTRVEGQPSLHQEIIEQEEY